MTEIAPLPALQPETIADLLEQLAVPASRVRLHPAPGVATVADLEPHNGRVGPLCELIDGALVAKAIGSRESVVGLTLGFLLRLYLSEHRVGILMGSDGGFALGDGQIRLPDVAFVSYERLPGGRLPAGYPSIAPDLAIEVLSPGNTAAEMARKRRELFAAGTLVVWEVDLPTMSVTVYEGADDEGALYGPEDTLDGAPALPGFTLPVADIFQDLPPA